MRKRPIALVAWMLLILAFTVLIGLIISCGSASEKEPPGPLFTEEEAIAILQQHLQTKRMEDVDVSCWTALLAFGMTWSAEYNSTAHRWDIEGHTRVAEIGDLYHIGPLNWSVYERTKSIVSAHTIFTPLSMSC